MAKRLTAESRGFTLIEVLVVMGVIGILVAMLMPVIGTVRESAKKSQAKSEAQRIETAIATYFSDYNKLPITASLQGGKDDFTAKVDTTPTSMSVIQALTTKDPSHTLNPRIVPYLAAQGQGDSGQYLDPWGTQYIIAFDANYDGVVGCYSSTNLAGPAVVISCGRDRKLDAGKPVDDIVSHGFPQ